MRSLNKIQLIGNLGQEPELRYSQAGDAILSFSLATSEVWKDKTTGEPQERTEWHRCVAYRKPAEILGQYAHKGSKLYVEGKLQTRKWQDKEGVERYTTEVQVQDFLLLDTREGDVGERASRPGKPPQYGGAQPGPAQPAYDDDIPF